MADLIRVGQQRSVTPQTTGVQAGRTQSPLATVGQLAQDYHQLNLQKHAVKLNAWKDQQYSEALNKVYMTAEDLRKEILTDEKEYQDRFKESFNEIIGNLDSRVLDQYQGRLSRISDTIMLDGLRDVEANWKNELAVSEDKITQRLIREAITAKDPSIPLQELAGVYGRSVGVTRSDPEAEIELQQATDNIHYARLLDAIAETPINGMNELEKQFDSGESYPIQNPDLFAKARRQIDTAKERKEKEFYEEQRVGFYDSFWAQFEEADTVDQFGSLIDMINATDNEVIHPTQKYNLRSMIRDKLDDFQNMIAFDDRMQRISQNLERPDPNNKDFQKNFNDWFNVEQRKQTKELLNIPEGPERTKRQVKFWNKNATTFSQAQLIPDSIISVLDQKMVDQDTTIDDLVMASKEYGVYKRIAPQAMAKNNLDSFIAYDWIASQEPISESHQAAVQKVMNSRMIFWEPSVQKAIRERFGGAEFKEKINTAVTDRFPGTMPGTQARIANQVERAFQLGFYNEGDINKAIDESFHNLSQTPHGISKSSVSTDGHQYFLESSPEMLNPSLGDSTVVSELLKNMLRKKGLYEDPKHELSFESVSRIGLFAGEGLAPIEAQEPFFIKTPTFRLASFKDTQNLGAWMVQQIDETGNVTFLTEPDTGDPVFFVINKNEYDMIATSREELAQELSAMQTGLNKSRVEEIKRLQRELELSNVPGLQ